MTTAKKIHQIGPGNRSLCGRRIVAGKRTLRATHTVAHVTCDTCLGGIGTKSPEKVTGADLKVGDSFEGLPGRGYLTAERIKERGIIRYVTSRNDEGQRSECFLLATTPITLKRAS